MGIENNNQGYFQHGKTEFLYQSKEVTKFADITSRQQPPHAHVSDHRRIDWHWPYRTHQATHRQQNKKGLPANTDPSTATYFFSDTCQRHFHQQTVWKIGQLQKTITSTMNDELPVMLVGFLRDLSRATSPSGYLLLALFAFPCLASVQIAQ